MSLLSVSCCAPLSCCICIHIIGVLLHDKTNVKMYVRKVSSVGAQVWQVEIQNRVVNYSLVNLPTDFHIGDSRMEYGGGKYEVYYHVHSDTGHEGDTAHTVTDAGVNATLWAWGCSHSSMYDVMTTS